jgi:S-methylmethionine-dependent homocysteine/selenocysteine methylase
MTTAKTFPLQREGQLFLTDGGIETEIMYKWGFELPHFAMYPLLDNPDAMSAVRAMYRRYLDVVAKHRLSALMGGLDYRASPDWGALLGYSPEALAEANLRSIAFLRELADEYADDIPQILIAGYVGPRGDAYQTNRTITAAEAEDYHAVQLATLKAADVDLAWALTFNNIPEAIGVARAAARIGVPLAISFTLDTTSRLSSGPSLARAVETVETETDGAPAFYSLNCSHPVEFEPALTPGGWTERVRGFRPNASRMDKIALCKLGHLEEGDPVELGRLMGTLARRYPHMDVWGGCCGTGDVHLDQIARNVGAARGDLAAVPPAKASTAAALGHP